MADTEARNTLAESAARQLANATKTRAQWGGISPRWLVPLLQWTPVEAGIYRLNRVKETRGATPIAGVECSPPRDRDADLPETFVDYDENAARVLPQCGDAPCSTCRRASPTSTASPSTRSRSSCACSSRRSRRSRRASSINNTEYGLLANTAPSMRISPRTGAPTPDDLDELIAKVWKEPAFFLAHPRAIAAFGRECTRRGVPPPTVTLFGSPFLTWRGLPLVPSDKVPLDDDGKSKILLLRTGEKKQGVVGLFQPGVPGEVAPSLSVRFMGINRKRHRLLPDLALLLARGADRGRARRAR